MKTNEKDTKKGVVPTLRFPEFSEAGEWQPTSIGALANATKGEQVNKIYLKPVGSYPVVNGGTQPSGYIEEYNTPAHTITISEGGNSCGFVNIINTNFWCGGHCYAIREKKGIDKVFLYQLLKKEEPSIMKLRVGSGLPNIQLRDLKKHPTHIPCTQKEQQKIADCLSSIDTLIKAAENKIDELKAHKKGLMQQLFPAEEKTVPACRFPEFQNAGEWKPYKLNYFGSLFRGLTYNTADVSNDNDGIGVLRSTNIQNNRLILDKDLVYVNKTCSSEQRLQKGDVVICMSNGSKALVGKNAELDQDIPYDLTIGAFCSIFRPKNVFAKYLLRTDSYTKFVALAIGGGNINNLKNSDLENFIQFAPTKPEEQQKIADCLSSVDDLITAQTNRLEALKTHKKGLMQQLFPNIDDREE